MHRPTRKRLVRDIPAPLDYAWTWAVDLGLDVTRPQWQRRAARGINYAFTYAYLARYRIRQLLHRPGTR